MQDRESLWEEILCATEAAFPGEERIPVPWEGPEEPKLILIGEAPGEQETLQRRPFAGKAGRILDGYLAATGLERSELYVTNTVKIRPWKLSSAGNRINRPPSARELRIYAPFLLRELRRLRTGLIVTLGNVPLKTLLGPDASVGGMHGEQTEWEGTPLIPMYHPAAVIYDPAKKDALARDMGIIAEFIKKQH